LGTETQNGIDIRIIVGVVIGIILIGIAVISVIIMRKKEQI
jgi:tetrahydromethanopterin S-methyltransferase subunit G